jgi:Lipocalin-like domain
VKKTFFLSVVSLCVGLISPMLAGSPIRVVSPNMQDQFVGGWRLVSLEQEGPDGKLHKADATGLLVFTPDGHFSVQVMDRNMPPQAAPGSAQYSQGGYEASFGTYQVDEKSHTFTFNVEGALVRSLIGKDLSRSFEFFGKQLFVKSTRPEEHWRVTWEHF